MASRKSGGKGGSVSLSDADRRYVEESLGAARSRGAASGNEQTSSLFEALESFGLSSERVDRLRQALGNIEVRESVDKAQEYLAEQIENARDYARDNPKKVIGGAAGVLVGASLLAYALRRAGGEEKSRARSSSKAGGAGSSSSKSSSKSSKKSSSSSKKRSSGGGSRKASKRR